MKFKILRFLGGPLFIFVFLMVSISVADETILIPFGSSGYRYQFVRSGNEAGFEKMDYGDVHFLTGDASFGIVSGPCALNSVAAIKTSWPSDKELLVRKMFHWDPDVKNLKVILAMSGGANVFINGRDISGRKVYSGCPSRDALSFQIPDEVLSEGENLIAVRATHQGLAFLDLQLTGQEQGITIIPYLASNYKYRFVNVGGGSGFQKTNFDDSAFRRGDAGFGSIGGNCPLNNSNTVKTEWPSSKDVLLRKFFELDSPQNLRISVAADNEVQMFVNERDVSNGLRTKGGCGRRNDFVFLVPRSFVNSGRNLIAARGRDTGGQRYLDFKVTVETSAGDLVVPYLSSGYKYLVVPHDQGEGFERPGFNDAAFANGRAAFGDRTGNCSLNNSTEVRTRWVGTTDILLRKSFDLGPNAKNLTVSVAVDNAVRVFLNGVEISNGFSTNNGCPRRGSFVFTAPRSLLKNGSNLLAVRARNLGGLSYIDVQVRAENP